MKEPDDRDSALTQAASLAALVFRTQMWTWKDKDDKDYVPSASDVRQCFERLLDGMTSWAHGTGRLVVEKDELHGYSLLMRLGNISIDEDSGA